MNVVNWQNAYDKSSNFKSSGPPKWAFVKEFLNRDFYEELYNTFPKFDDTWNVTDNEEKFAYNCSLIDQFGSILITKCI